MSNDQLHVAFMWHMHQPYYREADTGHCFMPWVRLHATKDYLFIPTLLREYPAVKGNFNLVPSLIKQINQYNAGASDTALDLSRRPPSELTRKDRIALLHTFFMANAENMILPYPAYAELYARRGNSLKDEDLECRLPLFSDQDFMDLQTWYNLVWIDPLVRARTPELQALIEKGKGFTEEDKQKVLAAQAAMLQEVIPLYRDMQESGQIEVSTTPFYHPILPLLCDTETAREAMMHIQLPERFSHPEDALEQLIRARRYYEESFGRPPAGMWPSEGSVSPQAAQLIAATGIQWIATDEEILAESLQRYSGESWDKTTHLYRPYRLPLPEGESLQMVFRDHWLSDQIGFVYQSWNPQDAVDHFLQRLRDIRQSLSGQPGPHLVSVILDGENAWEYYPGNGEEFLRRLFDGLSQADDLVTVRIGDYLRDHPAERTLPRIFSGSWINHNFRIWIGHPEDNTSWDYLSRTRQDLVEWQRDHMDEKHADARKTAWEAIYTAEGSDWNWWYGDDHSSSLDMEFDQLYRAQLSAVYRAIGKAVPEFLLLPIRKVQFLPGTIVSPTAFLSPRIDGLVSDYYEWLNAGYVDAKGTGGAMHQIAESVFRSVHFGFDLDRLYLRIDFAGTWLQEHAVENYELSLRFLEPKPRLLRFRELRPDTALDFYHRDEQGRWVVVKDHHIEGEVRRIVEMAVPFKALDAKAAEEVRFWISLKQGDRDVERCPRQGPISLKVPDETFESYIWNA